MVFRFQGEKPHRRPCVAQAHVGGVGLGLITLPFALRYSVL